MHSNKDNKYRETFPQHLSGKWLVTGKARFIFDEPKPKDLQFVKILTSPHAHARIVSIDKSQAQNIKGVSTVLSAEDIPGKNQIGVVAKDEPLLPHSKVNYVGQPVVIVAADSVAIAETAIKQIKIKYKLLKPILSINQALKNNSLLSEIRKIESGNIQKGFAQSDYVIEGLVNTCSQDHFYLETQIARAIPTEDNEFIIQSATQSPSEVQDVVARVLGLKNKDITVDVRRLGGGFGGKERAATIWACLAALAAYKTRKPCELRLSRVDDMSWRGKRHPMECKYKVGFNKDGKMKAYAIEFNIKGGAYTDLSLAIMQRAMVHADNAYFMPNARIIGRPLRTNFPPNTALRGFGAPQGIFAIEYTMERISHKLKIDPIKIRQANLYQTGQKTPYGQKIQDSNLSELFDRLKKNSGYDKLVQDVHKFNHKSNYIKRGIGITPVKFGLSFTKISHNQTSALIWIYEDGTISVSHGGIEMGQEVNTKVAQVVEKQFGVSLDRIRIESNNTRRIGNSTPTAASACADLNGNAAKIAADKIISKLKHFAQKLLYQKQKTKLENIVFKNNIIFDKQNPKSFITFTDLVKMAFAERIPLCAHGFYKTPNINFDPIKGQGSPFLYFVYGCALSLVEVDVLSGNFTIKKTYIVHEMGKSLNIAIDRGQIEGAFLQGVGWLTIEELLYDDKGFCITNTPSTYKIPTIKDIAQELNIEMIERDTPYSSVLGSKAIGEPPLIYGESVFFAIKNAIESVADYKFETNLTIPATPESIIMAIEELKKISD